MQKILGYLRKAIQQYDMIQKGDRIAVGISGGKDSMILLYGLILLRKFIGIDYDVAAVTIDPFFNKKSGNYSDIVNFCNKNNIEYHIIPTKIWEIVFEVRNEKSPCSLCSKMRRGALNNTASELGYNKIALGHNFDDTVETFIMNLFTEGRIGCYSPVTILTDRNLTIIRPLVLAPEREIRRAVKKNKIPVIKSDCPADGHTNRQKTKDFITEMEQKNHGFKNKIFGALQRSGIDGWNE